MKYDCGIRPNETTFSPPDREVSGITGTDCILQLVHILHKVSTVLATVLNLTIFFKRTFVVLLQKNDLQQYNYPTVKVVSACEKVCQIKDSVA